MTQMIDLTGQQFGELTVLKHAGSTTGKGQMALWLCQCSCDKNKLVTVVGGNLRNGTTRSCGHLRADVTRELKTKHGHRAGQKGDHRVTPEYTAWLEMNRRCNNPSFIGFANYGGRGIKVRYAKWRTSFETFLADVGYRPSKRHSLDRIDNDGHYEPGNVRWATRKQQAENRRPRRDKGVKRKPV